MATVLVLRCSSAAISTFKFHGRLLGRLWAALLVVAVVAAQVGCRDSRGVLERLDHLGQVVEDDALDAAAHFDRRGVSLQPQAPIVAACPESMTLPNFNALKFRLAAPVGSDPPVIAACPGTGRARWKSWTGKPRF